MIRFDDRQNKDILEPLNDEGEEQKGRFWTHTCKKRMR